MQSRLKSPVVWAAILGQLVIILTATGVIPIEVVGQVEVIGAALIEILTVVAVLNNPTNKNGF